MEKFRLLPSGKYNLQKYDYTDENGKRHYKSFTGRTKGEIRDAVAEWKNTRTKTPASVLVVSDAFQAYFDLKQNVLSPSTLRGYEGIKKNYIDTHQIGRMPVGKVKTPMVQAWVSGIAAGHTPKTVRNAYGLLTAVLSVYAPDTRLTVTLPQKERTALYCPDKGEIHAVLDVIRADGNKPIEIAVLLGAFIPARRSEICALTYGDIEGNVVTINKAMVHTPKNGWIIKKTKTTNSTRTVSVPQFVADAIPTGRPKDRVVPLTPDYITTKFAKYVKAAGVTPFRFHDLRHFGASMLLTVMSRRYVQDRGGWSSPYTMERVYNNVIDAEKARQTKKAFKVFEGFA